MKLTRHVRENRGVAELDWLSTRYSFSFANWYDPTRMGFGALRVINDDRIAAASGFPPHSHRDMEIITLVTAGALRHQDSMGNEGEVTAGEVQVMSAGTGVTHAEYNAREDEPLELFQIWIMPDKAGHAPRYAQKSFTEEKNGEDKSKNKSALQLLVAPLTHESEDSLGIHQDAYISLATVQQGESYTYAPHHAATQGAKGTHGVYVLVIEGDMAVCGVPLRNRDALGIEWGTEGGEPIMLSSTTQSAKALIFEVPV